MSNKTGRLIVEARSVESLLHHDSSRAKEELGPSLGYMSSDMVPEADVNLGIRHVIRVPADFKPHIEPHTHEVSQVYAVVGELTVEVMLDDEKHEVSGPAGIFIPAGMRHTIRPLKGSGYMVVVVRGGEYK
ncbi:hypothetical protein ACFLU4_02555 [Chloroflexota bacterium]